MMAPAQRGAARVAAVTALAVIAAFVAGKAARDAIMLARFDVRLMPWFIAGSAISSLPLVLVAGRVLARFGPHRVMPAVNVASALLLAVEWLALRWWPHAAAVAIYIHLSAVGAVLVSGFWSFVTERFDARVARAHIGRIGFGATLGGIAGGVIAERTGAYASTETLLLVVAALQVLCAVALALLGRGREVAVPAQAHATWSALGTVAKTPLLRTLALVVVLGAIASTALDFELKAELSARGTSALRFLAFYYAATSALTAIVQLVFGRGVIARLGVPRAVATLPATAAAAAALALAIPTLAGTLLARSAEYVMRSSIYRSAYELLYAPLADTHKRPTKVVIDVGAERLGDLAGAQIIALVLLVAPAPRSVVLAIAAIAGITGLGLARRLRQRYGAALEDSLLVRGPQVQAWQLDDDPAFSRYSMPRLEAEPAKFAVTVQRDRTLERLVELRSGELERVAAALVAPLPPELAAHVIPLLAWDAIAPRASEALRAIAPKCTGALVDALVDPRRVFAIRRRLPAVIAAGEPMHGAWGLWRGLSDARFEVRYRCARALARLHADGRDLGVETSDVFGAVARELETRSVEYHARLLDHDEETPLDRVLARRASLGLRHVFTLLALVLPARALQIALEAISTGEPAMRATAIEYLETVLPPEVRGPLWRLLDIESTATPRSNADVLAALEDAHPSIRASLDRIHRTQL